MTQDSSRLRLGVLGMVVLSLFCALLARLWYLQVLASPTFKVEAQHNSVAVVYTEAPRGRILDRNGKVLADNRVVLALVANREEVASARRCSSGSPTCSACPSTILNERIADERYSLFKPVPVAVDVPKDKLIYVREHQGDFPGIEGLQLTERVYPNGTLAAHVLGTVGEINDEELTPRKSDGYKAGDTIGKSGVELTYEKELRGEPEIAKLEVDSIGRVQRSLGGQPAVQGDDVRLSIDIDIQRAAEESLEQGLVLARRTSDFLTGKPFLAPGGSAVVARSPRRIGAGDGLQPHLQPQRVHQRHLRAPVRRAQRAGGALPPQQPRHPGPLRARVHLQAGDVRRRSACRHDHAPATPTTTWGATRSSANARPPSPTPAAPGTTS